MTDPTLTKEIGAAVEESGEIVVGTDGLAAMVTEMGKDISAIEAVDRVRAMALSKVRSDWEYIQSRIHSMDERVHRIANRFLRLQERHFTVVEGEPPAAEFSVSPIEEEGK
jgi:hypothetical protein